MSVAGSWAAHDQAVLACCWLVGVRTGVCSRFAYLAYVMAGTWNMTMFHVPAIIVVPPVSFRLLVELTR